MNIKKLYILEDRGILFIQGSDTKEFLQNLITNDINNVTEKSSCFASLLNPQGKYLSVLKGKIFDVALDLRKDSKTFGKYFTTIISENNSKSIFIVSIGLFFDSSLFFEALKIEDNPRPSRDFLFGSFICY